MSTTEEITDTPVVLFNNRKPDVCNYEDIYDPDNPQSGTYIPTLRSLVLKSDGTLWYVSRQDKITYKSTLTPVSIGKNTGTSTGGGGGEGGTVVDDSVSIISYGNDKYCIYIDKRTNPYRLAVDAKFLVYGNNIVEYGLYRTSKSGQEECISAYYDAAGKFHNNRIPMASISEEYPAYRYPTNCHTTASLTEGEPITMRVFNNLGNVATEATFYVREAIWWNDLTSQTNPIVSLNAECLQMRGDDFYVYTKQDPSHLNIRPYLTYSDGSRQYLNIDNQQCFLYGLEDYIPSYPGKHQTLIIKYFLNYKEIADRAETGSDGSNFLTCTKNLIVLNNENKYTVKLATMPLWDEDHDTWTLRWFAYSDSRDDVKDVTQYVTINKDYPFDGTLDSFGVEQHLVFDYDLQPLFQTDTSIASSQTLYLTVWAHDQYVKYTFRDSYDDTHIYGVDGSVTRRPIFWYDETLNQYFIPTSIFMNKEAVIESFYHLADPPYNPITETKVPEPTHFVVRDPYTGRQLNGGPIPLDQYGQAWPMVLGTEPQVGKTVLMEFLLEAGEGTYSLIYGVPVDVVAGTFNTEDN